MAESKVKTASATAPQEEQKNATPQQVLAMRVQEAKKAGLITPKLQRQFDRMAANLVKGKK